MTFSADSVAKLVNDLSSEPGAALREFLCPGAPTFYAVSPKSIGKRLKKHLDEPVKNGSVTLILRRTEDADSKVYNYFISRIAG